jgi:hypothetical protein
VWQISEAKEEKAKDSDPVIDHEGKDWQQQIH